MRFETVAFDERAQTGLGEFTFGSEESDSANDGVAVVAVEGERICLWREYQTRGPRSLADFIAVDGKAWQWHIANYPGEERPCRSI